MSAEAAAHVDDAHGDPTPPGELFDRFSSGDAFETARKCALLSDVADTDLIMEIGRRDLDVRTYWRDDVIADGALLDQEGPRLVLVLDGQIGIGVFSPALLREERDWSAGTTVDERRGKIRHQGPLMRLSERNVATFEPGNLFNTRAVQADDRRYAFYCLAPTEIMSISLAAVERLTTRYPALTERLANAVSFSQERLAGVSGLSHEVLDFYVRHGLSVAGTLRVLQVDRCIECKQCEKACADRYGVKRLSIHGPRLGLVGIATTCRTCIDHLCLDPCNFDSIEFDPDKGEVTIREESCVGCASCATACPYGSIEMVQVEDSANKKFKARLTRAKALAHGRGAARKEPAERIASKCDHCASFADQACITHCPTGALIEMAPAELFQTQRLGAKVAADRGFVTSPGSRAKPIMPARPFKDGLHREVSPSGKTKKRRVGAWLLWLVFGVGLVGGLAEIALRRFMPEWSFQYHQLRYAELEPAIAKFNVGYLAGSSMSLWLGFIGTGLMLAALLYPVRKRSRLLYKFSSGRAWFDLHLVGGTLGPLYIVLHSAFNLTNWVAIALWSIVVVVLSGIVGRFLYTKIPERFDGVSLIAAHHEATLTNRRQTHPQAVTAVRAEIASYRRWAKPKHDTSSFLGAMVWLFADDVRRLWMRFRLRSALRRSTAPVGVRRIMLHEARGIIAAERLRGVARRFEGFFRAWLRIHVMFTLVAVVVSIAHIVAALTFSM